jgi:hypothetical protein
LIRA